MMSGDATIAVELGFMSNSLAIPDDDHPGLLRAGARAAGPYGGEGVEVHECRATDASQHDAFRPDLFELGFDTADLSGFDDLQAVFARVAEAGHITDDDATEIRAALLGATLPLSSSTTAEVVFIADEGFIMRTSGPNRMSLVGPDSMGMNGHEAASSVHADQDVYGTPLVQLMGGEAPSLFRHDSPDGHNHDSEMMLVNVWIPLRQITQPLTLADGRSIDRRRHQLRLGLATTSFLERDDDAAINDIWTFLHDPSQRWYLHSDMDHGRAYVFNTLSTPHGAATLPGEDVAERCYRALEAAEAVVAAGDAHALVEAVTPLVGIEDRDGVPPALRSAITAMAAVAETAHGHPEAVCGDRADEWVAASQAARGRVVRMSLELRLVVNVST